LYKIAGHGYRCKRCGYTFHDFSGRWLSKCRIGSKNWLLIVKQFERGFSARQISKKIKVSYPTILKAIEVLRFAIIANSADADVWLDFLYFHPYTSIERQQKHEMITAFGILEHQGQAKIDILKDISLKTIYEYHPKMLRRSLVFYTDEYPPYAFLLFHYHIDDHPLPIDDGSGRMNAADSASKFLWFMKEIISKHRGITKEKFPLYLREIEFRYNHKNEQFFDLLCRFLVSFIPEG
jgi:transposase